MRSKLFMPGDKPERFEAALASGADVVSIDLEDTVTPANKPTARSRVAQLLATIDAGARARVLIRVNSVESGLVQQDLDALLGQGVSLFNLPKPESADDVRLVAAHLDRLERERGLAAGSTQLMVNLESPRGLRRAHEIASASARVVALQVGYADLLEPYGIDREFEPAIDHIRVAARLVAAELGIPVYDGVYAGLNNDAFFQQEAVRALRLGFAGKSCFNAAQVAIANATFQPSAELIAHAQRIVDTAADAFAKGDGIYVLDGRIVDEPFVIGARQVLARAKAVKELERRAAGTGAAT